jgi:hypothetical protein
LSAGDGGLGRRPPPQVKPPANTDSRRVAPAPGRQQVVAQSSAARKVCCRGRPSGRHRHRQRRPAVGDAADGEDSQPRRRKLDRQRMPPSVRQIHHGRLLSGVRSNSGRQRCARFDEEPHGVRVSPLRTGWGARAGHAPEGFAIHPRAIRSSPALPTRTGQRAPRMVPRTLTGARSYQDHTRDALGSGPGALRRSGAPSCARRAGPTVCGTSADLTPARDR